MLTIAHLPFNVLQQVVLALFEVRMLKFNRTISFLLYNSRVNMYYFTETIWKRFKIQMTKTEKSQKLWCFYEVCFPLYHPKGKKWFNHPKGKKWLMTLFQINCCPYSHIFSCLTKLAMLLCLKYLGRISFANLCSSKTRKLWPFWKNKESIN